MTQTDTSEQIAHYAQLIESLGGQSEAARALNIKQPSVWGWLNGRSKMSPIIALRAEKLTAGAFLAHDLCPQLGQI